jgi:hypothetical protein
MAGTTRTLVFAEGVDVVGPAQSFLETTSFTVYAGTAAFVTAKGEAAALGDAFADSLTNNVLFYDGTKWNTVNDIKSNFTAVADPTANDDTGDGYEVGSLWINTANGKVFVALDVTLTAAVWMQVGRALIGKREDFTASVNGVLDQFSLGFVPVEETLLVLLNGLVVPASQYTFVHPVITMATAPVLGQTLEVQYITNGSTSLVPIVITWRVTYHTLTGGEITAKQLTLPYTPLAGAQVLVDLIGGTSQDYSVDFSVTGAVVGWNGLGLESALIAGSKLRFAYYS